MPIMESTFGIVVHGGAGSLSPALKRDIRIRKQIMRQSASKGYSILRSGGSATDAVESAIRLLEDSQVFNAGAGSALTLEGRVQPDAAIMQGDLCCGAVGDADLVKNPISLARVVMERSDHVLIVGHENLLKFARAMKFPLQTLVPSNQRKRQFGQYISKILMGKITEWPKNTKLLGSYEKIGSDSSDTVGAVAIDKRGKVASGVSTGGRFLKLPGRVGDSAIVGAGLYADAGSGAASATGLGEEIIRMTLSKTVCDLMKVGLDAQAACDAAINQITNARGKGTAGVIAVDRRGRFGYSFNTEIMAHAIMFAGVKPHVAILPSREQKLVLGKGKRIRI